MNLRLSSILEENSTVLITTPYNMRYFSGFSGGEGAVWVSNNRRIVFTDSRYIESAQIEAKGFEVIETNDYLDALYNIIGTNPKVKIIFEDQNVSASLYFKLKEKFQNVEFASGSDALNKIRMIKTEDELKKIKRAEDICCRAFDRILDFIKPGISEKELSAELEYYMKRLGGEKLAFETIAISGARTSLPHGVPSEKKLQKGDFITLDFGCTLDGYSSDMTRTVVLGKATSEQKTIYNTVRDAQTAGLETIREGALAKDVDAAARNIIENAGFGKYFRHSLGHGVGLLVHELPNLSPKSEFVLKENMVVSCEPGIYIPEFGGVRIEDLVAVKKDGYINFTSASKDLIEL